jgi:Flp pilus assembly protein TadG
MFSALIRMIRGNRFLKNDQGIAMVYVSFIIVALLGMVGLAVDFGNAAVSYRKAQNAGDAAAMVAADSLKAGQTFAQATAAANSILLSSWQYPASALTLSFVDSNNIPAGTTGATVKVRASINQSLNTTFIRVLGVQTTAIQTRSAAQVGDAPPCMFCVMAPSGVYTFFDQGNGILVADGGGIWVNSTTVDAYKIQSGTLSVISPSIFGVVGGGSCVGCSVLPTKINPFLDPFRNAPTPSLPSTHSSISVSTGSQTISQGSYDDILISGGTLTMNPGIYIISNHLQITGGQLNGSGVFLDFTCGGAGGGSHPTAWNPGQTRASMSRDGGIYNLTAPTHGRF